MTRTKEQEQETRTDQEQKTRTDQEQRHSQSLTKQLMNKDRMIVEAQTLDLHVQSL